MRTTSPMPFALGALASGALLGYAWWHDARQRKNKAHFLHRALVDLLLNSLSAGDRRTERHSRRVADLTDALAATYPMSREESATLRVASLLHDMGKIDDRFFHIVHSGEPLTAEERERIEFHPWRSASILEPLERFHPGLTRVVSSHHECWNGEGYPRGLSGDAIPLAARIIAAADVFDALTQPRAYKEPMAPEEALETMERGAGNRFDPEVIARVRRPQVEARWRAIVLRGREEERAASDHAGAAAD